MHADHSSDLTVCALVPVEQRIILFMPVFMTVVFVGCCACCVGKRYHKVIDEACERAEAAWARLGARGARMNRLLGFLHAKISASQVSAYQRGRAHAFGGAHFRLRTLRGMPNLFLIGSNLAVIIVWHPIPSGVRGLRP